MNWLLAASDIGTGVATPVRKVAELIVELTGSKSPLKFVPLRTGETKVHTHSDIGPAKQYLDWAPRYSLREGLIRTIPWYAQQLGLKAPPLPVSAAA